MAERCIWSNREDVGTRPVVLHTPEQRTGEESVPVCPAHEDEVRRFHAFTNRYGPVLLGLVGITVLAILLSAASGVEFGVGVSLIFFGLALIVLPLPTPQTIALFGMRRSIWIVRIIGVGVIGLGVDALLDTL